MASSAKKRKLRTIADPFVVAPPTGTSTRTRVLADTAEDAALRTIGDYLGSLYRSDLAARIKIGVVPVALRQRAERKKALTGRTTSRWAGAITRASEDQYHLSMRALADHTASLQHSITAIERRLSAPAGGISVTGVRGYRNKSEQFHKIRRMASLEDRLAAAQSSTTAGTPTIVVGSRALVKKRHNLGAAGLTLRDWRAQWDAARMFQTADGESPQVGGNQTIRVTGDGTLSIRVPIALVDELGTKTLTIAAPVSFALRANEWADRVRERRAIRYDLTYDAIKGRWHLNASWSYHDDAVVPPLAALQTGRIVGVDLNADHITAGIIDPSGNPVGTPQIIPLVVAGLSASARDGHLRQTITTLLDVTERAGAAAIAVENLNFSDARDIGRETLGRGSRGKRFRKTVSGIPTGKFRQRLTAMAANRGIWIIAVDPAYTSRWGKQHWATPLQQRTSDRSVTGHQAAAVAIGRRAHGHSIRRRKDGPRTQQSTRAGQPQTAPELDPMTRMAKTGPPRR